MDRLYQQDSYLQEFDAEIINCLPEGENSKLWLTRTAFYPESGGQPSDLGWINGFPVLDVSDSEEGPVHLVSANSFAKGDKIKGAIDWRRRFDHMQHHTGQHILSRSFIEVAGSNTVSFHLGKKYTTIDLDVESLPGETIREVESEANRIITSNLPIRILTVPSERQKEFPIRKLSSRRGNVRIVQIGEWDFDPCGGTHCRATGEIGILKITGTERVRQQLRIFFLCGERALNDYRNKSDLVNAVGLEFSCGESDILTNLRKAREEQAVLAREQRKNREKLTSLVARELASTQVEEQKGVRMIVQLVEDQNLQELNKLASIILESGKADLLLLASPEPRPGVVFAGIPGGNIPDLRKILLGSKDLFGGKGGGSPDRVQAGGSDAAGLLPALKLARELVLTELSP